MRLRPLNDVGTRVVTPSWGSTVMDPAAASWSTSTPSERRMSAVICTSPTSGTWRMVLAPSPSTAATMCLVTAFFEPRMNTSPRSGPEGDGPGSCAHGRQG
ncbi:MAG: hypothetical protein R2711_06670 [Acidimicrobiales bacterium]